MKISTNQPMSIHHYSKILILTREKKQHFTSTHFADHDIWARGNFGTEQFGRKIRPRPTHFLSDFLATKYVRQCGAFAQSLLQSSRTIVFERPPVEIKD